MVVVDDTVALPAALVTAGRRAGGRKGQMQQLVLVWLAWVALPHIHPRPKAERRHSLSSWLPHSCHDYVHGHFGVLKSGEPQFAMDTATPASAHSRRRLSGSCARASASQRHC